MRKQEEDRIARREGEKRANFEGRRGKACQTRAQAAET